MNNLILQTMRDSSSNRAVVNEIPPTDFITINVGVQIALLLLQNGHSAARIAADAEALALDAVEESRIVHGAES